jgi:hypothetical protein
MARVRCAVDDTHLPGDYDLVPGVCVTCGRCGHTAESYGTDTPSVRRALVMLREECPRGENNFYVADDGSDQD